MNRVSMVLFCLVALALGWFGYERFSVESARAGSSASTAQLAPAVEGSKIYFVPIGNFPREQLDQLAKYYHRKYGVPIAVAQQLPVDPATKDESREQLIAEALVASMRSHFAENARKAVLIGFTSEDIYPASQSWPFAFGWRITSDRTAVVSTARMDLNYAGEPSGVNLPDTRLKKVVTKNIGILYYGLPQSANPTSVLYDQILGIQELDQVGEDL